MAAGSLIAKLLHVDLTTRQTRVEEVPEPTAGRLAELGLSDVKV